MALSKWLFLLLLAAATSAIAQAPAYSEAWFQKAKTLYREGKVQESVNILQIGVDAGHSPSIRALAKMHQGKPEFIGKDPAKAVPMLEKLVTEGDIEAAYYLALIYRNGLGVPQDLEKGFVWLKRAGDGRYVGAYAQLGAAYLDGTGVPRDVTNGLFWLQRSVQAGDKAGMHALGRAYMDGDGIRVDLASALELIQRSADLGFEPGRRDLPLVKAQLEAQRAAARQNP